MSNSSMRRTARREPHGDRAFRGGPGWGAIEHQVLGDRHLEDTARGMAVLGDDTDSGAAIAPALPVGTTPTIHLDVPDSSSSRLDSTSPKAAWPLPSTPATPTISPGRTCSDRPSSNVRPSVDTTHPRSSAPMVRVVQWSGARLTSIHRRQLDQTQRGRTCDRNDTRGPPSPSRAPPRSPRLVGIDATTRPSRMIVTRSVACRISSSLWLTSATARPSSRTTCRSTPKSSIDSAGVSTDVGSSKMRIEGLRRRHLRISTRCRCAGSQVTDDGIGIDLEAIAPNRSRAIRPRRPCGSRRRVVAENHVLPHPQRLDEAEVLVHHADAVFGRGGRVRQSRLQRHRRRRRSARTSCRAPRRSGTTSARSTIRTSRRCGRPATRSRRPPR